ncbi:uncharacterized protein LOC141713705 isoform X2 [Apium graveolens]
MEVFNMVYLGAKNVQAMDQHGFITLISDKGSQFLYSIREEHVDATQPAIRFKDDICVTVNGPTCYFKNLRMEFDLFSHAYKDTLNIRWMPEDYEDCCDTEALLEHLPEVDLLEKRVQSRDGTREISILMGLFLNATVANVKVKLLGNFVGLDVYGVVAASNSKVDDCKGTSVLFARKANREISLGADGLIPLSQSRVAVPLNSVLSVEISLHVNGECYRASVPVRAKYSGTSHEKDSESVFEVSVEWDANRESVYSEYDHAYAGF